MPLPFFRRPLDYLYLFVHIPKCAGTTLVTSFAPLGKKKYLVISQYPESKASALAAVNQLIREHRTTADQIDVIAGHDVFMRMHVVSPREPFYFTVLRDPIERYISHYRYLVDVACMRKDVKSDFARKNMLENGNPISLEQFAERRFMTNVMTQYLAAANHPDPQTGREELTDSAELLELAQSCLGMMSWIGLVEEFPNDLNFVCRKLRVRPTASTNQSLTRVSELPKRVEELVRQNNNLDYQIYERAAELRVKLNSQA